jgi:hypothetical protein
MPMPSVDPPARIHDHPLHRGNVTIERSTRLNSLVAGSRTGPLAVLARPFATMMLVVSVLGAALPLASPASAQATDTLAAFVPGDSLVYVDVNLDPDSDQVALARELLERSNIEALLSSDDQDALDDTVDVAGDLVDGDVAFFVSPSIADDISIDKLVDDAPSLTEDPTAIASVIPTGWAAIIRSSDPETTYDMIVDGLESSAASDVWSPDATPAAVDDAAYDTTEYEGYDILSVAATEYSSGQAVALVGDVIVVGQVPDDITPVIDVVNGDSDPLAGVNEYSDIRDALASETLASGYVNGPAVGAIIANSSSADLAAVPDEIIASLVAYQGFAVWADDPGFRFDTVAIPAAGTDLAVPDAYEGNLTSIVPADAMVFAGGTDLGSNPQLDALALTFAAELAGVSPDDLGTPVDLEATADEIVAEAEDVLGFNLRTDVLDQLSGEWAVAGTTDLSTGSAILVSEVDDPEVVSDVVAQVTDLIVASGDDETFTVDSRTVDGAEVTVIELESEPEPLTIEFGVIDGKLAVAVNGWLDHIVKAPPASLADDGNFNDALGYLPSDITGVAYINLETVLPVVTEAMNAFSGTSTEDADPSCGDYASQEEAQAAYDEDNFENYQLDLDWDGEACEDYFAPATPVTGDAGAETLNVSALASVTWAEDGRTGSNAIIVIGE